MNVARYWAVFFLGVAAGAAVALIYAPQSGEKTRKQLSAIWMMRVITSRKTSGDLGKHARSCLQENKDVAEDVGGACELGSR